jgi:hypothetical protein
MAHVHGGQNNRTTEQQNNRTTEQQNNRTTEQQNKETFSFVFILFGNETRRYVLRTFRDGVPL